MLTLFFLGTAGMNAQVTIGDSSEPREGAILDLQSDSKGLLLPQVLLTDIGVYLPGVTPIDGMLVFNTNEGILNGEGKGVYVWDNTKLQWVFNGYRAGAVVVPVTEVKVTAPVDFIISGHDLQFTAEVIPAGATNRTVSWDVVPGMAAAPLRKPVYLPPRRPVRYRYGLFPTITLLLRERKPLKWWFLLLRWTGLR